MNLRYTNTVRAWRGCKKGNKKLLFPDIANHLVRSKETSTSIYLTVLFDIVFEFKFELAVDTVNQGSDFSQGKISTNTDA